MRRHKNVYQCKCDHQEVTRKKLCGDKCKDNLFNTNVRNDTQRLTIRTNGRIASSS